jgi:hypothetical protein
MMEIAACLETFRSKHPEHAALLEQHCGLDRRSGERFTQMLAAYLAWRAAKKSPSGFLDAQLTAAGISTWWPRYPRRIVQRLLQKDTVLLWVNDDTTIAAALAQWVLDGKIVARMRSRALVCLDRQLQDVVVQYRAYADPRSAMHCLAQVRRWLEQR